jgi:hypothetical protein
MFNHPPVKDLARNFIGDQINREVHKGITQGEYKLKHVEKETNHKEAVNNELKNLKPNIKGLISKIQNPTGETTIDLTSTSHNIDINLIKQI